jgi:hypothetical protein
MYFGFLRRESDPEGAAYQLNVINNVTPDKFPG